MLSTYDAEKNTIDGVPMEVVSKLNAFQKSRDEKKAVKLSGPQRIIYMAVYIASFAFGWVAVSFIISQLSK